MATKAKAPSMGKGVVVRITVDGTVERLASDTSLEAMQAAVGGYVEVVIRPLCLTADQRMLVDEEGKLKGKPINRLASKLAGQVIAGDAVLMEGVDTW